MLRMKTPSRIGILGLFFLLLINFQKISLPVQRYLNNVPNDVSSKMAEQSKAEIVSELKAIKNRIERLEKLNGVSGTNGFKV